MEIYNITFWSLKSCFKYGQPKVMTDNQKLQPGWHFFFFLICTLDVKPKHGYTKSLYLWLCYSNFLFPIVVAFLAKSFHLLLSPMTFLTKIVLYSNSAINSFIGSLKHFDVYMEAVCKLHQKYCIANQYGCYNTGLKVTRQIAFI